MDNIKSLLREALNELINHKENLIYEDEFGSVEMTNYIADDENLNEAEYKGRKVKLGKIMQGDVKKFKVYVKNDKGKVVKVNFGFGGKSAKGKRMTIKKNNPERRRNFRARHNCDNPGPRWKPRYWACRTW
jgi:D-Tyr-tRNAtyr deacylase